MKRILATLLIVFGFTLATGTPTLAQETSAKGFVERLLENVLGAEGRTLSIENVSIALNGNVTASRVEVRDPDEAWIVLEGLRLEWRPLSLFRSQLEISKLSLDRVDWKRLPRSQEGQVAIPQEFKGLNAARIESLSVGEIALGPDVLGEPVRLTLDGSGTVIAEPAEIQLDIAARRIDQIRGELNGRISVDPRTRKLNVDLGLSENADGFIASLLKLRDEPSVDLKIKAEGDLDRWKGNVNLVLDGKPVVQGDAAGEPADGGQRVAIDVRGLIAPLLPEALEEAFAGTSTLAAAAIISRDQGTVRIESFTADNQAFTLTLDGVADWRGSANDLNLSLRAKNKDAVLTLPPIAGLGSVEINGLASSAKVSGSVTNPKWSAELYWDRAIGDPLSLQRLEAQVEGQGYRRSEGPIMLDGKVTTFVDQGRSNALPPAAVGAAALDLSGTLSATNLLTVTKGTLTLGTTEINATGSADLASRQFAFDIDGEAQSPSTGIVIFDRLLQGAVRAGGRLSGDASQRITLQDLNLRSDAAVAKLNGILDAATVDITAEAQLTDLGLLHEEASGQARFDARISGPWASLDAQVKGTGENVTLLGHPFAEPKLDAQFKAGAAAEGQLNFTGVLDQKPVRIAAALSTDEAGRHRLQGITASIGSATAEGAFSWKALTDLEGSFSFAAPDLTEVAPLLLSDLSGSASGEVSVTGANDAQSLAVTFKADSLAVPNLAARQAEGRFSVATPFAEPQAAGKISLAKARLGGLSFDSLNIDAKPKGSDSFSLGIDATGRDLSLNADTLIAFANGNASYTVSKLTGKARGIAFQSAGPFSLNQAKNRLTVDKLSVALGKGRMTLDGQLSPVLNAKLGLSNLPLTAFAQLSGLDGLAGTLSGNVTLAGKPNAPDGTFSLDGSGVTARTFSERGLPPLGLKAKGTLKGGVATIAGTATSNKDLSSDINGTIKFGPLVTLDLRLKGRAGNKVFSERLSRANVRLEGNLGFDVRVSGAASRPDIDGILTLSNGIIGDTAGQLIVRSVAGKAAITDRVLRIETLAGTVGKNGRATGSGTISLDPGLAADLRVKIDNGIYTDGTFLISRYDADLKVTGQLANSPLIAGDITLRDTKITLSALPRRPLTPLEVKHRNAPPKITKQAAALQERARKGGAGVQLDVRLKAGNPISISGRGLNVALDGSMRVTGTPGALVPEGSFKMERGSVTLPARRLEFERGTLTFDSNFDPLIDFTAVSRRSDATITLAVRGRASEPEIRVTSSPELPEEEALAKLIFDNSLLQLSPLQAAQIANYIATLSGNSDAGLLTGLQNALGFDWLDFTESETGEAQVGIGKRLNDKLSVGVEQGTETGTTRVIIDLNATRSLKLRGAVGSDGSTRAGVYYEKDY